MKFIRIHSLGIIAAFSMLTTTQAFSAPYVSAEIGHSGLTVTEQTFDFYTKLDERHYDAITARFGGGYLWCFGKRTQLGMETALSIYKSAPFYYNYFELVKKRYNIDALAVIDYRFTKRFHVFAKAGAAYVMDRMSTKYIPPTGWVEPYNPEGFMPEMALSLGYDLTQKININVSFFREFETNNLSGGGSLNLGIKYTFLDNC